MIFVSRAALAAALAMSVSGVALAAPVMQFRSGAAHHGAPRGTNRKLSVLYDQTANDSGIAFVSQNFEASLSNYDVAAADDFVVPAGQTWSAKEIDVVGKYYNGYGPNASEDVTFYADENGKPGKPLKKGAFTGLTGSDDGGSLAIALPKSVKLKPGHYWVSVVANLDFDSGGEWGWELQTTHENDNAMFKSGNADWTDIGSGDLMFTLKGKSK